MPDHEEVYYALARRASEGAARIPRWRVGLTSHREIMPKTALVATTVLEPKFLAGYLASARRYDRLREVHLYVIIDSKTPSSVRATCHEAARQGFHIHCPTLDEQTAFLRNLGAPADWIP